MNRFQPLEKPLAFLGVFCLAALLLLPVWIYASRLYMAGSIALVNACTHWAGLPAAFQLPSQGGGEVTNPSIVAGVALFIATPHRPLSWKAGWTAGLIALFWCLHSLLLILQVQVAFSHALQQIPPAQARLLADRVLLPALRGDYLPSLVDGCERWAFPVLAPLLWFVAARHPASTEVTPLRDTGVSHR